MNKSLLVLKREYLTRVKKKSFIILTLLVPFIFGALTVLPTYLAMMDDEKERIIGVYDSTGIFLGRIENTEYTLFHFMPEQEYEDAKANLKSNKYYSLLYIPPNVLSSNRVQMISHKQINFEIKNMVDRKLERILEADKKQKVIDESGIPDLEDKLAATKTRLNVETIMQGEKGEAVKSSSEMAMGFGYAGGFVIYMFVFIYGAMVMRGVMEEKTNRIVEVVISSVKPFQLLFGKIVGIGLVGLTQLVFWIVLGTAITAGIQLAFGINPESIGQSQNLMQSGSQQIQAAAGQENVALELIEMAGNLNLGLILFSFLFYFICGFMMYASLMGAVGSAVDHEEDAQQLMLPVTIPLIFSIIVLFAVAKNPEGSLAFWMSMIPLTSPVVMMARVPFGIPIWELALSMGILILSILGTIWMAGKIYRTGILMYGKKAGFKEIVKWLTYRN